jgi:hypothetical protein
LSYFGRCQWLLGLAQHRLDRFMQTGTPRQSAGSRAPPGLFGGCLSPLRPTTLASRSLGLRIGSAYRRLGIGNAIGGPRGPKQLVRLFGEFNEAVQTFGDRIKRLYELSISVV